jgi:hypothetical protein
MGRAEAGGAETFADAGRLLGTNRASANELAITRQLCQHRRGQGTGRYDFRRASTTRSR